MLNDARRINDLDLTRYQVAVMGYMATGLFLLIGGVQALAFRSYEDAIGYSLTGVAWGMLAATIWGTMSIVLKVKVKSYNKRITRLSF